MLWQKFSWKVCWSGCSLVEKAALGIENRATTRLVSSCVKLSCLVLRECCSFYKLPLLAPDIFGTLAENYRWHCLGGVHFGPLRAWGKDIVSHSFTDATSCYLDHPRSLSYSESKLREFFLRLATSSPGRTFSREACGSWQFFVCSSTFVGLEHSSVAIKVSCEELRTRSSTTCHVG